VVGVVFLIVSKLGIPRFARTSLALASLVLYVALVGPQPSVLRAGLMAGLVILAQAFGRRSVTNRVLALVVIVLLLVNPLLATNAGFQLSVLATLGIIELAAAIASRLSQRLPAWLALAAGVSISAQLLCFPVLLQLQSGVPTYSVPANLFAEPLVAPITILAMAACVAAPLAPWLSSILTWVASLGAWLIIQLSNYFASLPESTIQWAPGILGFSLAVATVIIAVIWIRASKGRARTISGAFAAISIAVLIGSFGGHALQDANWPPPAWDVISCDVGQGDATVINSSGHFALIDVGRDAGKIKKCLDRLQIKHLDLLLLTHFDFDHVGGLDGALAGRTVELGMITSYHDDRPEAGFVFRELEGASARFVRAAKGMTGRLGELDWTILSPHLNAPEASDPNDGSVTMIFRDSRFVLLCLADLGEKGQIRLVDEASSWLGEGFGSLPVIVKVSHHGSADQLAHLYDLLHPTVALISVGVGNPYGHPTQRTLRFLASDSQSIFRTDQSGNIAVTDTAEGLQVSISGHG
jgi:competence protein ComEC